MAPISDNRYFYQLHIKFINIAREKNFIIIFSYLDYVL